MIAPIVVLTIGTFVGLMVVMVGDVLSTRDQAAITYDTQSALNRIEQDTRLSTQFLMTSGTQTSPQGSDSNFTGTAAFTNTSNLILSELATDKNPADPSRALIYFVNQPNPCGTTQRFNRVLLTKVIYFIKSGSLWRRTIVPDNNTNSTPDNNSVCATPWQLNSCSPGYSAAICKTNDEEVMKNIYSMSVGYYTSADDTVDQGAANALTANTIGVTIVAKKSVAGRDIDNTGTMRATKLNSIDTTLAAPAAPSVSHTLATPNSVQFNWTSVPTATSYQVAYQINSGTWISQTIDANTLNYTISGNRTDVINFKVAAFNGGGGSAYTTDTQTLPAWATFNITSTPQWVDFGGTHATHAFTKTPDGVVVLKGLLKNGNTATDTVIGTLPEGYRPSSRLIFVTTTNSNAEARLAIFPDGSLVASETDAAYFSLSGISFLADNPSQTWITPTFVNGWTNVNAVGGTWQTLRATKDASTRVHIQGDIKQGTYTVNTPIATMPAAYMPAQFLLFSGKSDLATGGFNTFGVNPTGTAIVARGTSSAYLNTNTMYYPSTYAGWTDLTLKGGWAAFSLVNGTYAWPQYTKSADGIVTIKGLIKSGTVTSGTVIATLPPGYRPAATLVFAVSQNYDFGRIDILSNGDIVTRAVSATWTSMDQISFIAEQ